MKGHSIQLIIAPGLVSELCLHGNWVLQFRHCLPFYLSGSHLASPVVDGPPEGGREELAVWCDCLSTLAPTRRVLLVYWTQAAENLALFFILKVFEIRQVFLLRL